MRFELKGVIPPMITPFTSAGEVDVAALKVLVRFLEDKVHGLFICGSYGSGPLMSVEERKLVAETVRNETNKLTVIVMTGAANTRDTVELARHAKKIGCDAVSAVTPYYYHHSMDDVVQFYQDILDEVGTAYPVYIYTNPKFSGYNVDMATMRRLKEIGVHGVKAASFDIMEYAGYKREFMGQDFDVSLGTEALWLAACSYGGQSFIPGLANAFPEICMKMFDEGMRGDLTACRETQFKVNELRNIMYLAKSTQLAIYAMLEIRGVLKAYPRKPFTPATVEQLAVMESKLKEMGMIQ